MDLICNTNQVKNIVADMLSRTPITESHSTADQQRSKIEIFITYINENKSPQFIDISDE